MTGMERFHLDLLADREVARWFHLLHELETRPYVSAKILSEKVGTTSRTVNSDIVKIRDYFSMSISIHSDSKGYQLEVNDREEYQLVKQHLLLKDPLPLILDRLLVSKELSFFELSEELHFSESTLMRYLKRLWEVLQSFRINLSMDPVALQGSEVDVRNFYLFYFYDIELTRTALTIPKFISQFVENFFKEFHGMSQTSLPFLKFCYMVYLSAERSNQGFYVKCDNKIMEQVKQSELFKQLYSFNTLSNPYVISSWTEEEIGYLCALFLVNQGIGTTPFITLPYTADQRLVKKLGIKIYEELFSENRELFLININEYIESQAIKYKFSPTYFLVKSEVVQYAKSRYPRMYDQVYTILSEDVSYLTLFPEAKIEQFTAEFTIRLSAIKNSIPNRMKKIVFLFEGNEEICLNLKAITKRYLGGFHNLYYLNYQEIIELPELEIDLLVTNCQEYKELYEEETEVLFLHSVLTTEDWNELLKRINKDTLNHFSLK